VTVSVAVPFSLDLVTVLVQSAAAEAVRNIFGIVVLKMRSSELPEGIVGLHGTAEDGSTGPRPINEVARLSPPLRRCKF